mmetsp:Transcript_16911/g.27838  ORF Transcript_16911/g.27838 Transcript_16911/m.27838 type:complete len:374 (+) Transcript_16911:764-1885(+)
MTELVDLLVDGLQLIRGVGGDGRRDDRRLLDVTDTLDEGLELELADELGLEGVLGLGGDADDVVHVLVGVEVGSEGREVGGLVDELEGKEDGLVETFLEEGLAVGELLLDLVGIHRVTTDETRLADHEVEFLVLLALLEDDDLDAVDDQLVLEVVEALESLATDVTLGKQHTKPLSEVAQLGELGGIELLSLLVEGLLLREQSRKGDEGLLEGLDGVVGGTGLFEGQTHEGHGEVKVRVRETAEVGGEGVDGSALDRVDRVEVASSPDDLVEGPVVVEGLRDELEGVEDEGVVLLRGLLEDVLIDRHSTATLLGDSGEVAVALLDEGLRHDQADLLEVLDKSVVDEPAGLVSGEGGVVRVRAVAIKVEVEHFG